MPPFWAEPVWPLLWVNPRVGTDPRIIWALKITHHNKILVYGNVQILLIIVTMHVHKQLLMPPLAFDYTFCPTEGVLDT